MSESKKTKPKSKAMSPEEREASIISLAYDEAEQRILNGTASSQLLTHFLKRGSPREELEVEILGEQANHLRAKTQALNNQANMEKVVEKAMRALTSYQTGEPMEDDDEDL